MAADLDLIVEPSEVMKPAVFVLSRLVAGQIPPHAADDRKLSRREFGASR